jgi:hypothetical protein
MPSAPETRRLSRQCQAILDLLRRGRVSNHTLAQISLKYTSRLSDLRAAGHDVRVVTQDRRTGVTVYELRPSPARMRQPSMFSLTEESR